MGWASGSRIAIDMISVVQENVRSKPKRRAIYGELLRTLEHHCPDCGVDLRVPYEARAYCGTCSPVCGKPATVLPLEAPEPDRVTTYERAPHGERIWQAVEDWKRAGYEPWETLAREHPIRSEAVRLWQAAWLARERERIALAHVERVADAEVGGPATITKPCWTAAPDAEQARADVIAALDEAYRELARAPIRPERCAFVPMPADPQLPAVGEEVEVHDGYDESAGRVMWTRAVVVRHSETGGFVWRYTDEVDEGSWYPTQAEGELWRRIPADADDWSCSRCPRPASAHVGGRCPDAPKRTPRVWDVVEVRLTDDGPWRWRSEGAS